MSGLTLGANDAGAMGWWTIPRRVPREEPGTAFLASAMAVCVKLFSAAASWAEALEMFMPFLVRAYRPEMVKSVFLSRRAYVARALCSAARDSISRVEHSTMQPRRGRGRCSECEVCFCWCFAGVVSLVV